MIDAWKHHPLFHITELIDIDIFEPILIDDIDSELGELNEYGLLIPIELIISRTSYSVSMSLKSLKLISSCYTLNVEQIPIVIKITDDEIEEIDFSDYCAIKNIHPIQRNNIRWLRASFVMDF